MAVELLLSPIKKEHSFKPPQQGRWQSAPDFLTKYSSDIEIGTQISDRDGMLNVPTVFARPVYFLQALEDNRHPAHRHVRGQWRGLLAIFALQRWLGGAVQAQEFSLLDVWERANRDGGRADLPWLTILKNQLPKPTEEWKRWWLLRFHDQLIGATSPATIVYTPAQYRCPPAVPWQNKEGQLIDPIDFYDPQRKEGKYELSLLAAWVRLLLKDESVRWGVADNASWNRSMAVVVRELQAWSRDLRRYEKQELVNLELTSTTAPIREVPFDRLLVGLKLDEKRSESDLLLRAVDGTQYVLLSRKNFAPGRRVHGSVLVDQLQLDRLPASKAEKGWKTPDGQEIPYGYVIAEEVFLPAKLLELPLTNEAFSVGSDRFALPLTPEFFRFFTLEQLKRQNILADVSVTQASVTVRLHLPLESGEVFPVERSYKRDQDVISEIVNEASFGFWPDFYDPEWKNNLAFLAAPPEAGLIAAPFSAGGVVLPPCSPGESKKALRVWESLDPVLGFSLQWQDPATARTHSAGVVVRKEQPAVVKPRGRSWQVAVDFGTSSTHVMVREDGDPGPRMLKFEPRTVILTNAIVDLTYSVQTAFYPSTQAVEWPSPTLLFLNRGTLVAGPTTEAAHRALYSPDFVFVRELIADIVEDLKWAGRATPGERTALLEYLRSIVRGVVCEARAEGVEKLLFHWSFPLALPLGSRQAMKEFWSAVAASFDIPGQLDVTESGGISESEALCRHLRSSSWNPLAIGADSLSIAVDVGGGSSDVAFWSSGQLLDQVSLKLAGNDILPALKDFPGFVSGLVEACAPADMASTWQERIETKAAPLLNILLSRPVDARGKRVDLKDPKAHPLPRWLANRGKSGEPPWLVGRTLVYLFASGLSFYFGLHARKLLPQLDIKEVGVLFGGRGSMLLTWLAQGEKLGEVLRTAFKAGVSLDAPANAGIEPRVHAPGIWSDPRSKPKSEVVQGMLTRALEHEAGAAMVEEARRPTTTLLGEIGWQNKAGENLDWDERVNSKQLAQLIPPVNHDTGYIADFLSQVVPRYLDELNLDSNCLRGLRIAPDKVQNALRGSVSGGYEVLQPVFAVELKVLLETYVERARAAYGGG